MSISKSQFFHCNKIRNKTIWKKNNRNKWIIKSIIEDFSGNNEYLKMKYCTVCNEKYFLKNLNIIKTKGETDFGIKGQIIMNSTKPV